VFSHRRASNDADVQAVKVRIHATFHFSCGGSRAVGFLGPHSMHKAFDSDKAAAGGTV
jgi:hypothetical protein